MTTLQEMRDYVRLYLDLDDEDLPDIVFDEFAEEGASKIVEREANWPFLETSVVFTPVVGQSFYDTELNFPTLEFITSIVRTSTGVTPNDLVWTSYRSRNSWPVFGETVAWTEYGGQLHLFPAPTVADQLVLTGILKVSGWTAGGPGSSPPLPEPFHQLVLKWALAMTYAQQDDPDNAALHASEFDRRLEQLWRKYLTEPRAAGLKIGSVKRPPTVGPPSWPSGF